MLTKRKPIRSNLGMFGFFKMKEDHIKPLDAFGSTKVCSKCGGKRFDRTFVPYSSVPQILVYYYEHIEAECKKCGATFWEKTKDAK